MTMNAIHHELIAGAPSVSPDRDNLLDAILQHFPGGIAVYDDDLRLTLCTDNLKRMLEYPDELFEFGPPTMEQVFRFNALRGEYGKGDIEHLVAARIELASKKEAHCYRRAQRIYGEGRSSPQVGFMFDISQEGDARHKTPS